MRNLLALGFLVLGTVAAGGLASAQSQEQPDLVGVCQSTVDDKTTPPAPVGSQPEVSAMATEEPMGDTDDGADKPACAPASSRACSDVCNGDYGMLCMWGTVCDPVRHYCEKTSP